MSRPPHKPTPRDRHLVETLAGLAFRHDQIGAVMQISGPTLRRAYRKELDRGSAVVEANLVGNLLRLAGGNDGTALKAIMFSLRCRFGWSEFSPPRRPEPLGKKEAANQEAQTAHEESDWGDLLH